MVAAIRYNAKNFEKYRLEIAIFNEMCYNVVDKKQSFLEK